jgi:hypothetical protein
MARSRILVANWDYPQYYDIAFQAYTPTGDRLHRGCMQVSIALSTSAGCWSLPAAAAA